MSGLTGGRSLGAAAAAAALLVAAFIAQVNASRSASAVVDEPAHLTAGYLSLVRGDLGFNREHPPLLKALAALPLLFLRPVLPPIDPAGPAPGTEDFEFDYARRFIYHANAADRLLAAARIPIMIMTALLGCLVFVWTREIAGAVAAVAATALYALEPNILAHGGLVTTDLGAAAFSLGFLWALRRAARAGSIGTAAGAGALLGCALLSKFSTLLLLPLGAILVVIDRLLAPRGPAGGGRLKPARLGTLAAIALAICWLILEAGYGFSGVPVPRLYVEGLELARIKNAVYEGPTYLMGAISKDGFWSYYLVAFLVKTPLPLLALGVLGLVAGVTSPRLRRESAWILLPAAAWLGAMTILTRAQIGFRYVLPVTPLLCVAGGIGAAYLLRLPASRGVTWLSRGAVALLLLWHVAAAARIHPYHLAYFNEAAGGPAQGWKWLVDSNLDWGQDLIGLRRWLDARGDPPVNLFYFGTADPDHYGIRRRPYGAPQPGLFAVSATHLAGVYLPDPGYLAEFRALEPEARIGWSIFVYRLDEVPPGLRRPLLKGATHSD